MTIATTTDEDEFFSSSQDAIYEDPNFLRALDLADPPLSVDQLAEQRVLNERRRTLQASIKDTQAKLAERQNNLEGKFRLFDRSRLSYNPHSKHSVTAVRELQHGPGLQES